MYLSFRCIKSYLLHKTHMKYLISVEKGVIEFQRRKEINVLQAYKEWFYWHKLALELRFEENKGVREDISDRV